MTTPELLEFIRIEHALGMPLSEISRLLITEGEWDEEDVAEAFAALGLSTRPIETAAAPVEAPAPVAPAPAIEAVAEVIAPVVAPEPVAQAEVVPELVAVVAPVEETPAPAQAPTFEPIQIESVESIAKPKLPAVEDRAKLVEEIFSTGPVFEPFAVTDASEPLLATEGEANPKEESAPIQSDAEANALLETKQKQEAEALAREAEESKRKADEVAALAAKEAEEKAKADEALKAAEDAKKIEDAKLAEISAPKEVSEIDQAEDEIKSKIAAEKAEAEDEARAAAEAKARLEVEARMKAEDEARIRIEAEMKVRAEIEAKNAAQKAVAGLGVPVIAQAPVIGQAPMMAAGVAPIMMPAPIIYATQVVAQAPAQKPAEKFTPMRAATTLTPSSKPTTPAEPAGPRPIKFDIGKLRTDVKSASPTAVASAAGSRALSPEDFFRAQTAGDGLLAGAGSDDIARSLKVPHKRTMLGDLKRMEEGTLSAQVSGSSVTEEGGAATPANAALLASTTEQSSDGSIVASPTAAPAVELPPKTGSPWLVLGAALLFLTISVALTAYYILVYRLPVSSDLLLSQAIATTMKSGNAIHYQGSFETDILKEGGEHLVARIADVGDGTADGRGFASSHHKLQVAVDDNGVNVPVSLHYSGEIANIGDKYYLHSDPSASMSDAFSKAASSWIEASESQIGVVLGLQSTGKPVATLGGAQISDMISSSSPWRTTGAVSRSGGAPVVIAPDEYSIPVALDADKTIALIDSFGVLLRGSDAEVTNEARKEILHGRYGAISGHVIVDRKTKKILSINLGAKYPKTGSDVTGEIKFTLALTTPTKTLSEKAPTGFKTLEDLYGAPSNAGTSSETSTAPIVPPTPPSANAASGTTATSTPQATSVLVPSATSSVKTPQKR